MSGAYDLSGVARALGEELGREQIRREAEAVAPERDYYQNWVCGRCGTSLDLAALTADKREICGRCGTEVRYPEECELCGEPESHVCEDCGHWTCVRHCEG